MAQFHNRVRPARFYTVYPLFSKGFNLMLRHELGFMLELGHSLIVFLSTTVVHP